MIRGRTRQPRRRAATAVETAVILLPFVVFIFALFEYARFTMCRNLVVNAAREGCRLAVVNTDVNNTSSNLVTEDVRQAVLNRLAGQRLGTVTIRVYHAKADGTLVNSDWATKATYQQNVALEVQAAYGALFPTFGFFSPDGSDTVPLTAKVVMGSEGH